VAYGSGRTLLRNFAAGRRSDRFCGHALDLADGDSFLAGGVFSDIFPGPESRHSHGARPHRLSKVEEAEWIETTAGARFRVSIFLSVFDVHVNRVPISGRVTVMEYREGQFLNAMNPESAILNEQTLVVIEDGEHSVSFKQIAGLLARRIICDVKTGDVVQRGQRMGMIKFGSRVDVLMPADVELRVKPGDRVQGGKSILGVLPGYGEDKKSSYGRS
jgi:phosphatidylserine decarboxylase